MRRTLLLLALAVGAIPARADEPALLLPASLGRPDTVWIAGRVLEEAHGRHGPVALSNARTLAAGNLEGARVEPKPAPDPRARRRGSRARSSGSTSAR